MPFAPAGIVVGPHCGALIFKNHVHRCSVAVARCAGRTDAAHLSAPPTGLSLPSPLVSSSSSAALTLAVVGNALHDNLFSGVQIAVASDATVAHPTIVMGNDMRAERCAAHIALVPAGIVSFGSMLGSSASPHNPAPLVVAENFLLGGTHGVAYCSRSDRQQPSTSRAEDRNLTVCSTTFAGQSGHGIVVAVSASEPASDSGAESPFDGATCAANIDIRNVHFGAVSRSALHICGPRITVTDEQQRSFTPVLINLGHSTMVNCATGIDCVTLPDPVAVFTREAVPASSSPVHMGGGGRGLGAGLNRSLRLQRGDLASLAATVSVAPVSSSDPAGAAATTSTQLLSQLAVRMVSILGCDVAATVESFTTKFDGVTIADCKQGVVAKFLASVSIRYGELLRCGAFGVMASGPQATAVLSSCRIFGAKAGFGVSEGCSITVTDCAVAECEIGIIAQRGARGTVSQCGVASSKRAAVMLLGDCPVDLVKNTIKAVGTNEEAAFLCAGTENEEKALRIAKEMKRNTVTFEREANAPPPVKKAGSTEQTKPGAAGQTGSASPTGALDLLMQKSSRTPPTSVEEFAPRAFAGSFGYLALVLAKSSDLLSPTGAKAAAARRTGKETLSNSPQNAPLVPHMSPPGGTGIGGGGAAFAAGTTAGPLYSVSAQYTRALGESIARAMNFVSRLKRVSRAHGDICFYDGFDASAPKSAKCTHVYTAAVEAPPTKCLTDVNVTRGPQCNATDAADAVGHLLRESDGPSSLPFNLVEMWDEIDDAFAEAADDVQATADAAADAKATRGVAQAVARAMADDEVMSEAGSDNDDDAHSVDGWKRTRQRSNIISSAPSWTAAIARSYAATAAAKDRRRLDAAAAAGSPLSSSASPRILTTAEGSRSHTGTTGGGGAGRRQGGGKQHDADGAAAAKSGGRNRSQSVVHIDTAASRREAAVRQAVKGEKDKQAAKKLRRQSVKGSTIGAGGKSPFSSDAFTPSPRGVGASHLDVRRSTRSRSSSVVSISPAQRSVVPPPGASPAGANMTTPPDSKKILNSPVLLKSLVKMTSNAKRAQARVRERSASVVSIMDASTNKSPLLPRTRGSSVTKRDQQGPSSDVDSLAVSPNPISIDPSAAPDHTPPPALVVREESVTVDAGADGGAWSLAADVAGRNIPLGPSADGDDVRRPPPLDTPRAGQPKRPGSRLGATGHAGSSPAAPSRRVQRCWEAALASRPSSRITTNT
jgi:hypothetical protein